MYCIYIFIAYIDIYLRVCVCVCGFVLYIIPMNFNNVLQFIVSNKSISANASVSILHTLSTLRSSLFNCTFLLYSFNLIINSVFQCAFLLFYYLSLLLLLLFLFLWPPKETENCVCNLHALTTSINQRTHKSLTNNRSK